MKLSESVKPISHIKAHASQILADIVENRKTVVVTQNGEAKAILQDIGVYEETQESLALLKMIAQSKAGLRDGKVKTLRQSFRSIRRRIAEASKE